MSSPKPPKYAKKLLTFFCAEDWANELIGDLEEQFLDNSYSNGVLRAKLQYWWEVFRLMRPHIFKASRKNSSVMMTRNYFKISFRNLVKNKTYTFINLAGMSLAFAFALAIFAFVSHELSYDRYHTNADRVFRVTQRFQNNDGYDIHWARVNLPYINELAEEAPEIKSLVRFQSFRPRRVLVEEQKFTESNAFAVDPEVFEMFDFKLLAGDKSALTEPQTVVLTESIATKYFGNQNPIGRIIKIHNDATDMRLSYTVTGVMEDQPSNTHLPISFLSSINGSDERVGWAYIYLLLNQSRDALGLKEKLPEFVKEKDINGGEGTTLGLQPIVDIHLHSNLSRELKANSNSSYIVLFSIVAIFLVLISSVNFANLSIVKSLSRSKEVGVRRVLGSEKSQLYAMFMVEAVVLIGASILVAVILYLAISPLLASLTGHQLFLNWTSVILGGSGLIVLIALVSSAYPARIVMRYALGSSLRGKVDSLPKHTRFKKSLIGLQFLITLTLLSGTLLLQRQFSYLTSRQLGYDKDQLLAIDNIPREAKTSYEVFKSELLGVNGIKDVSAILELPSRPVKDEGRVVVSGRPEGEAFTADIQVMDFNGLDVLGIDLVAGSNIPSSTRSQPRLPDPEEDLGTFLLNKRRAYMINESALKIFGWSTPEEAINQQITWSIGALSLGRAPIVGVVKDFHQESLHATIDPVVFAYEPIWMNNILIKTASDDYPSLIGKIEAVWDRMFPELPIKLTFADQEVDRLYQAEQVQRTLMMAFSLIAILITLLGFYAIISYNLERRLKEMGIRKVLGAKLTNLFGLIGKEYLLIAVISLLLSIPLIWTFGKKWLEAYMYRIEMNGMSILIAFGFLTCILLTTLVLQIMKLNKRNPVEVLKAE
ncbi:FtsX-like permease family protein [Roseivirga sp.]|uniref:FtsX-like permease family protein n=1 Tax=Roseivirga sp. TaxID=1964215 RepID=UPI003B8CF4A9